MEKTFKLDIVTPDRDFYSGEVESLIIPAVNGEMGIMRHTLPLVTVIKSGIIRIKKNDRWMEALCSDGFVSVMRDKTTVLTQMCEWPYEVDMDDSREEIHEPSDRSRKEKSLYEYKMAKAQLAVQFAKLKRNKNNIE